MSLRPTSIKCAALLVFLQLVVRLLQPRRVLLMYCGQNFARRVKNERSTDALIESCDLEHKWPVNGVFAHVILRAHTRLPHKAFYLHCADRRLLQRPKVLNWNDNCFAARRVRARLSSV